MSMPSEPAAVPEMARYLPVRRTRTKCFLRRRSVEVLHAVVAEEAVVLVLAAAEEVVVIGIRDRAEIGPPSTTTEIVSRAAARRRAAGVEIRTIVIVGTPDTRTRPEIREMTAMSETTNAISFVRSPNVLLTNRSQPRMSRRRPLLLQLLHSARFLAVSRPLPRSSLSPANLPRQAREL